ncbi:hypothetical protein Micbo1qcDRAFT_158949 [Microdochium bolleyi]|uniref:Uncharacterized protein n=1 Tax=Microdochium bolleyi TaxID=196109 RepID=A0A136JA26_9PEZI|nr:hypothetical protein Micbo1qcDRAFT_158949 [Microdochium bolleyi]
MATSKEQPQSDERPPTYEHCTAGLPRLRPFDEPQWRIDPCIRVEFLFAPPEVEGGGVWWEARVNVRTKDLPRLMREGLFWTAGNFHHEAGWVARNPLKKPFSDYGYKHCRVYYLSSSEKDNHGEYLWVAQLALYTVHTLELATFRPARDLTPARIVFVEAHNEPRKTEVYYKYFRGKPHLSFNTIYDDMLLPGWWPDIKHQSQSDRRPGSTEASFKRE